MVLIALAALVASPQQSRPFTAVAQATATIRIVSAVRLKWDAAVNPGAPPSRDCLIRSSDGSIQPAKLIEFQ
jgi:hypothetical protein